MDVRDRHKTLLILGTATALSVVVAKEYIRMRREHEALEFEEYDARMRVDYIPVTFSPKPSGSEMQVENIIPDVPKSSKEPSFFGSLIDKYIRHRTYYGSGMLSRDFSR